MVVVSTKQDMSHCALCYAEQPALVLPMEDFELHMPGVAKSIWNDEDWPLCADCELLISRRYFRKLAERCADIRTAAYRDRGDLVIRRDESLQFFMRFLSDVTKHIDQTRVIYANDMLEEEGDR